MLSSFLVRHLRAPLPRLPPQASVPFLPQADFMNVQMIMVPLYPRAGIVTGGIMAKVVDSTRIVSDSAGDVTCRHDGSSHAPARA